MLSLRDRAGIGRAMSRLRGYAVRAAVILALVGSSPSAGAAPKDELATKMNQDAIDNDYLAMRFPEADRKLRQAIAICGKTGCSPNVTAQLHRDLGTVHISSTTLNDCKAQFAR